MSSHHEHHPETVACVGEAFANGLTSAAVEVREKGRGRLYTADMVADLLTGLAADFCNAADRAREGQS